MGKTLAVQGPERPRESHTKDGHTKLCPGNPDVARAGGRHSQGGKGEAVATLLRVLDNAGYGVLRPLQLRGGRRLPKNAPHYPYEPRHHRA